MGQELADIPALASLPPQALAALESAQARADANNKRVEVRLCVFSSHAAAQLNSAQLSTCKVVHACCFCMCCEVLQTEHTAAGCNHLKVERAEPCEEAWLRPHETPSSFPCAEIAAWAACHVSCNGLHQLLRHIPGLC